MLLSSLISEVSGQLSSGCVSASQLVDQCLARIRRVRALNAFVTVTDHSARLEARAADQRQRQGVRRGVLDGVPVAVKDNFCVANSVTSCGSAMLAPFRPPYTATVVAQLQRAGAIVIGKTNLDEFAMGVGTTDSHYGATRNVWRSGLSYRLRYSPEVTITPEVPTSGVDDDADFFVPGGSSGGSAVAVAAGCCFGALGSDTGGSVRNPAACCGLVGLKPSYGRLSRHGLVPLVNSLDVPGLLARSVADVATLYNAINCSDPLDSTCLSDQVLPRRPLLLDDAAASSSLSCSSSGSLPLADLVVGVPSEYRCPDMCDQVLDAWESSAQLLAEAGATLKPVSLPHTHLSIASYTVLNCAEVSSNMARYTGLVYGYRADTDPALSHPSSSSSPTLADVGSCTESLFAASRHRSLNHVVRGRILAGNFFLLKSNYEAYVAQAMRLRRLIRRDFDNVWRQGCHLLLTPVTISDGVRHSEFVRRDSRANTAALDVCTQPANMAGIPALSLPVAVSSRGLPIGVQLMAPMFQEQLLLSAARWLECRVAFPRLELLL